MAETETDANAAESSTAETDLDVTPAESSPAEGEQPSFDDAIDAAFKETEESPASEEAGKDAEGGADPKGAEAAKPEDELPDEPSEDELKKYPELTRKRVTTLLEQRRELRSQLEDVSPKAEQWDQVEKFREANGLSPEQLASAIQVAALMERDPVKAFEVIAPMVRSLADRAGYGLSDDLKEAVKTGEITHERALEVSRARAEAANAKAAQTRDAERAQQQTQTERQKQHVDTLTRFSQQWDAQQKATNPDWHLMRDEVAHRVGLRVKAEGLPKDVQTYQALLDDEVKTVKGFMSRLAPKPTPTRRQAVSDASTRSGDSAPKSVNEAVDRALGVA